MTLREYINVNYSDLSEFVNVGLFDRCSKVFFPNKNDVPTNLLTVINYEPFNYGEENGGSFASFVTNYILSNYVDNELNHKYLSIGSGISALQNQIMLLMCRYRYKWQALYKTTTIDGEYNILDNVNEIFDETVTRTPNITHEKNGETTNGVRESNISNVYGEQTTNETNKRGAVTNTETNNIGAREDTTTTVNGVTRTTNETLNSTYPYDDPNVGYSTDKSSSTTSTDSVTNTETNNMGAQTVTNQHNENERTDTTNASVSARTDTQSIVDNEHIDKVSETLKESGDETTVYSRRRHGNIGVTTSGQLIEDFRRTHYMDIIKIVGNDIVNEIVSLMWGDCIGN